MGLVTGAGPFSAGAMTIITAEKGRVVGLVSIGDVVKSRIEEAVREAEALKEYIAAGN